MNDIPCFDHGTNMLKYVETTWYLATTCAGVHERVRFRPRSVNCLAELGALLVKECRDSDGLPCQCVYASTASIPKDVWKHAQYKN